MIKRKPTFAFLVENPAHFFALGFGSGLAPVAPGTFGSILSWPLYLLLAAFFSPIQIIILSVVFFVIGIYFCAVAGKALGVVDHGAIVWDEIVACLLFYALIPQTWQAQLGALILFRVFDIAKPWPISWFDRKWKNGFGVMWDDLLAAVMGWFVFLFVHALFIR